VRILVTSSIYPTPAAPKVVGGAEIFVRRLTECLSESGDSVEVIRAASESNQEVETCNGIDVYSAPVNNLYLPFTEHRSPPIRGIWHAMEDWQKTASTVTERIKTFKPDILHSNNLSGLTTAVWKAARDLQIPVLHTLHDYYLTCPRCSRFSSGRACDHTCMSCALLTVNRRKATKYLNGVVGVSQRILDIHTGLGLFANTPLRTVIRHASALAPVTPVSARRNGPLALGFIGRLTEEKGIYNLVRAIAKLPQDSVRLVIGGHASAPVQKRLRALAPKARIDFLGFVAPELFYQQIDIVVIPPIWEEPGPIVVVDAQAARKPFLGTPFGGIPEAVAAGAVGWLTAPDPDSLAESIRAILSKPEAIAAKVETLSTKNPRRFSEVVAEYRETFERLRRRKE
jgi:glycosyltransferase involved in cell wall biosynthesis